MLRRWIFALLFLALCLPLWSDSIDFTTQLALSLPLAVITTDAGPFRWAESLTVRADYPLPFLPFLFLEAAADFDRLHLPIPDPVSTVGASAGAGITLGLGGRLQLRASADAGYLLAIFTGPWSSSWFVEANSSVALWINPSFAVAAGVMYKLVSGLYEEAGVSVSVVQRVPVEAP